MIGRYMFSALLPGMELWTINTLKKKKNTGIFENYRFRPRERPKKEC